LDGPLAFHKLGEVFDQGRGDNCQDFGLRCTLRHVVALQRRKRECLAEKVVQPIWVTRDDDGDNGHGVLDVRIPARKKRNIDSNNKRRECDQSEAMKKSNIDSNRKRRECDQSEAMKKKK